MADPAKQKPSPFSRMLADGACTARELQREAEALADKMAGVHGGTWSAHLDHQRYFVLIAKDFG